MPDEPPSSAIPLSATSDSVLAKLNCHYCQASFTGTFRKGNLGRHIRIFHEKHKREWPCGVHGCYRVFKRSDARLKHQRKHHPELQLLRSSPRNLSSGSSIGVDEVTANKAKGSSSGYSPYESTLKSHTSTISTQKPLALGPHPKICDRLSLRRDSRSTGGPPHRQYTISRDDTISQSELLKRKLKALRSPPCHARI